MQQKLADYFIIKVVGEGHNSEIYKARDTERKDCAVKIVKHDIHQYDPKIVANEVEVLKELHNPHPHPHIVQIYDFIGKINFNDIQSEHISSLIVFELLEEGTLTDFIEDYLIYFKKFSHREAVARTYFWDLLETVRYCHKDKKIIHRDLKPANILLDKQYSLKIIDWEYAAKVEDLSEKNFQTFTGTKSFMSPEIIELQKGDENHYYAPAPADIYACGIILYFMITGTFPYGKASVEDALFKKYVYNNAQFWKDIKKKYKMSPELVEILNGMLNLKTEDRYTFEQIFVSKWIQKPRLKQEYILEMVVKIKEIKHQQLTAKDEAEIIEKYISEKCEILLSQE